MWQLAYHPVLLKKLKRKLFMYIITYLYTYGLWIDSGSGNGKEEWKKNGNGNVIGKKPSSFVWWPVILWY